MSPVEFQVLPHGEQWQLSRNGSRIAIFATKQETIEAACDRAQLEEISSIVVHDGHGHVQGTAVKTANLTGDQDSPDHQS